MTLSAVIALWLGISIAVSFRLLTYAIRSRNGTSIARPGCSILLNFPMRSTIHAVCWGTNLTMVFAGREGRWKYEDGIEEPPRPIRPELFGLLGEAWRVLRWGRTDPVVLCADIPTARGRIALDEMAAGEAAAFADDDKATRAAASKAMFRAQT